MISPVDWEGLSELSTVEYVEKEKVTQGELLDIIAGYDYLMLNRDVVDELGEDFYKGVRERELPLKAISADITGMTWAHPDIAKKYDVPLMNTPNYSTVSVAEFSVALLLMMAKKIDKVWQARVKGEKDIPYKNDALEGKTVGVVGLGNIGTKFAGLLTGFGMEVIGWDREDKKLNGVTQTSLQDVIARSDYVSIHLKTANETKNIFNQELLSHAKPGQIIINEADGELVDNDAMLEAINQNIIAGYACSNEAVKNHVLESNPSVVTMPAQAWFTDHSLARLREIWVGNVIAAMNGKAEHLV